MGQGFLPGGCVVDSVFTGILGSDLFRYLLVFLVFDVVFFTLLDVYVRRPLSKKMSKWFFGGR